MYKRQVERTSYLIPTISSNGLNDLVIMCEIEKKLCKFIIDTGSSISLIKEGISRCATHKTAINANGVTGSNLFVKGTQNLRLRLGSVEVVHTFLVVPRDDSFFHVYDGILGLDLLKSLGAIIDLPSRRMSLNNNSVAISLDSGVEDCRIVSTSITIGCGPDQPITRCNFVGNNAEF